MPANQARRLLTLCLLLSPAVLRAADAEIPTVGRPADLPFSEASGDFRVHARAAPTVSEVDKPFTFTLIIQAVRPVLQPPRRIDLRELPTFKARFDFLEGDQDDDHRPDERTWEFVYRLQAKREDVRDVPAVPFVFFNPEIQYPRKGFQVAYTDALPLIVTAADAFPVPLTAPDRILTFAAGEPVLRHWTQWGPPGPAATAALLLGSPLLCVAWYFAWRRLYPDAARIARMRRSLAARRALHALRGLGRLPPQERAVRSAAAVAEYLRGRYDAPAEEPTPVEAAACLVRAGCPPGLAEQAAAFFRSCDAVRFGPDGAAAGPDLSAEAGRLVLGVEAETWSASRS